METARIQEDGVKMEVDGADGLVDDYNFDDDQHQDQLGQEDLWAVVTSYFEEKGLVRQQLDSFDSFINTSLTELVDDTPAIRVRPHAQYLPGQHQQQRSTYIVSLEKSSWASLSSSRAISRRRCCFPTRRGCTILRTALVYVGVNCGSAGV